MILYPKRTNECDEGGVSLTEGEEMMVLMKMVLSLLMEEDGGGEGSLGSW